jgi:nickel-dependent lactate racemase
MAVEAQERKDAGVIRSRAVAAKEAVLTEQAIRRALEETLSGTLRGKRVLALIPDHTRTVPLPMLFRLLAEILRDSARLDFLVALGTHPRMEDGHLLRLIGITAEERHSDYRHVGLLNHAWEDPSALTSVGSLPQAEIRRMAGDRWHPSLGGDVDVLLNRAAVECDEVLILGPTFPHEVAGFSGGAKYLVPGISGAPMIHKTHWLGALGGVTRTIGIKDTPVRAMIHAAADRLSVPVTLLALVVEQAGLAGLYCGGVRAAWSAAADLSAQHHIRRCNRRYRRILSCAMPMYDELWTAAKAVYKLEPVVEEGGEIILYAPYLKSVSVTHGEGIARVGYHSLPFFLEDWNRFRDVPLAVLAHSTHVRGAGRMENGIEVPHHRVTLATGIPAEECARLNLGYLDPAQVNPAEWENREQEGILLVPEAGEMLYRTAEGIP